MKDEDNMIIIETLQRYVNGEVIVVRNYNCFVVYINHYDFRHEYRDIITYEDWVSNEISKYKLITDILERYKIAVRKSFFK